MSACGSQEATRRKSHHIFFRIPSHFSCHKLVSWDRLFPHALLLSLNHQMIEKRRRDRINNSLNELRRLVPAAFEKQGSAKLEKAEILQMTVDHLTMLHAKGEEKPEKQRLLSPCVLMCLLLPVVRKEVTGRGGEAVPLIA